jgi:hypothetical protein
VGIKRRKEFHSLVAGWKVNEKGLNLITVVYNTL